MTISLEAKKVMEHLIPYMLFENVSDTLKKEVSDISYIIEDENFQINTVYNAKDDEFYIYISKLFNPMHKYVNDDVISEFYDRINVSLGTHGYKVIDSKFIFHDKHITFHKMQSNDAGDILKIIYGKS